MLQLEQRPGLHPPEIKALVEDLFPAGMTSHGWQYLWSNAWNAGHTMTEALVEYVRRAEFPHRPSRFQSIFVFESLADARTFRLRYPGANGVQGNIFVVGADESFRCNMPLMDFGASVSVGLAMTRDYWRGERGYAEELWEHLLTRPVTLLRAAE